MYTTCVTATRNKKVTRRERWDGLTGVAVADASGSTIERRERSCVGQTNGGRGVMAMSENT